MKPIAFRLVLALFVASCSGFAVGAQPTTPDVAPTEARLFVEILDAKGKPTADLAPADLEIREGGQVLPVRRFDPQGIRRSPATGGDDEENEERIDPFAARTVIYFDQALLSPSAVRRAAEIGQGVSQELTALGEVELVSAPLDGEPESLVRAENSLIIGERLSRMALSERGLRSILAIREATEADLRRGAAATPPMSRDERRARVAQGIDEELELVHARLELLAATVLEAELPHAKPLVLIWVLDGFDFDPLSFYASRLDAEDWQGLAANPRQLVSLSQQVAQLAEAFAAAGWTIWALAPQLGDEKAVKFTPLVSDDGQGSQTVLPGVTLKPSQIFGKDKKADAADSGAPQLAELLQPLEPLRQLAAVTGGELIETERALRDAAERFGRRVAVYFPSPLKPGDGSVPVDFSVVRPGLKVRGARFRSAAAPPVQAEWRLGRIEAGAGDDFGLSVAAALRPAVAEDRAFLETRLDLREIKEELAAGPTTLRLTLDLITPQGRQRLLQESLAPQALGAVDEWVDRRELTLPAAANELLVLVEDLEGGRWGGGRANILAEAAADAGNDVLPPPRTIELVRPEEGVLRGRIKFEAQVLDPGVKRVLFVLDDREVAEVKSPPWSARIDLGRTPRRQSLGVVAYDAKGLAIGRDTITLNGGEAGFGVKIVKPTELQGSGLIEVEAEVSIPTERKLERVLFFWNTELQATLFSVPFRQVIRVPEDRPVGYVRVVALLDDGSLGEDVIFLNGPQGDRLDVQLVELYTVVTDENSRPVRGLASTDFLIREDGAEQEIASFSDARDLPLTLGLALDSSASMFVKLPQVQKAAVEFLRANFKAEDRGLIIDFDDTPRLTRGATSNLERLTEAIESLEASGRTALWESIVFSLVQLQGIQGRKALVIFSDGADEDDQFPFRSTLRIAKELGVPIYLILMRKQPEESAALGLLTRSFTSRVDRLAEATGGRVIYAKDYKNLAAVYDEIDAELRSQYLLTYYPKRKADQGWRDVEVVVKQPGLRARTVTGYLQ